MALNDSERIARLRLIRTDNVGPATFHALITRYGSAAIALEQISELSRRGGRAKPIKPASLKLIEEEWHATHKAGAQFIMLGDDDYPQMLTAIEPIPPLFSALGHVHLMNRKCVAMVGARNASANSRKIATDMGRDLGQHGYVIASGLARGIDTAAHAGALDTGTIAVLAGGVTSVYPKENEALYASIAEQGLIISEMPLGHIGRAKDFPRRNRLISGLSHAVVVVEAALRSGSLITARNALEQSREVLAVPGSPLDPRCRGANHLIKQGAALVENAEDVITHLETFMPRMLADPPPQKDPLADQPLSISDQELDRFRSEIIMLLGPAPTEIDEIIRQSGCSPGVVSIILLELDLAGRIERWPGQKVSLIDT
ncbi:MAG: DNA-protecting protein DprA [Alphaproteobacteria bacterium]|nr:MAG: DNA-protecting protein DprA [Alphaproteobacteria bacterium]